MEPDHLRLDATLDASRATSSHVSECPDIGPICSRRPEPPQQHHTTIWAAELRFLAELGLSKDFAVQAILPLRGVQTSTTYSDLQGNPITLDYPSIHHHDELVAGPGDLQLLAHLVFRPLGLGVGVRAGLSVPFGVVHQNPEQLGALGRSHEHIQNGTGTLDPVLGLDLAHRLGPVTVAAFAQVQPPLYEGSTGYRAGVRAVGGVTVRAGVGRLAALLAHEGADRWNGAIPSDDANLGRTDLFVGPGATLTFGDWSVSADVRVRVYSHAVGASFELPLLVELGVGKLEHLESNPVDAPIAGDYADADPDEPLVAVSGKWTVFDFWAPWCEACKAVDKRLRALVEHDARVAVRRVDITDFDSEVAHRELPGVTVLPHVRLVSPDGIRAYEASGTPEVLLGELEQRLRTPAR